MSGNQETTVYGGSSESDRGAAHSDNMTTERGELPVLNFDIEAELRACEDVRMQDATRGSNLKPTATADHGHSSSTGEGRSAREVASSPEHHLYGSALGADGYSDDSSSSIYARSPSVVSSSLSSYYVGSPDSSGYASSGGGGVYPQSYAVPENAAWKNAGAYFPDTARQQYVHQTRSPIQGTVPPSSNSHLQSMVTRPGLFYPHGAINQPVFNVYPPALDQYRNYWWGTGALRATANPSTAPQVSFPQQVVPIQGQSPSMAIHHNGVSRPNSLPLRGAIQRSGDVMAQQRVSPAMSGASLRNAIGVNYCMFCRRAQVGDGSFPIWERRDPPTYEEATRNRVFQNQLSAPKKTRRM